jgi:hypothetical protein
VRWDGFGSFASAYGSRLDISAPSDNILDTSDAGAVSISGGTSASSPEVAAAAAVALQVARLTGKPFSSAKAVRQFLVAHANPLPNVLEADQKLTVGPQLDLTRTVEALFAQGGIHLTPHVDRVAIAQRYPVDASDFGFLTDTDPTTIDLTGADDDTYNETGYTMYQPITIAPDWEGLPAGTKFRLYVTGKPSKILSTNRYARLYPGPLLTAAGQAPYSADARTVNLTYEAIVGLRAVASTNVALRFLPNTRELHGMGPPPDVAPVSKGATIPVSYDISNVDLSVELDPTLTISYPGRTSTAQPSFRPLYQVKLTKPKGVIDIPVSALQGDGIYGLAVTFINYIGGEETDSTTWGYTRVDTAGDSRPAAPLLSSPYEGAGYYVDVPYGSSFNVAWDVSNVKGATGAILEIAAPGPTLYSNYQTFNNPNGSEIDHNGVDSGSEYTVNVSGTKGTTTIQQSKLLASQYQSVRVIPTNGGSVVGEGSYQSMIATHGIESADGGNIAGGFSINPNGTDALLASNQLIPMSPGSDYLFTSSIEPFSQTTNTIGSFIADNSKTVDLNTYLYNSFPNYFNVWGMGIDSTSDAAYFQVPPGYSQNCTPNCNTTLGLVPGINLQWFPSVSTFANGQASGQQPGAQRPLPMATPPGELYTAENNGYLLATDPYAFDNVDNAPALTQLGTSTNVYSEPSYQTTYALTNLDEVLTYGTSIGGGYAATLANNESNIVDVTNLSTGATQSLTLASAVANSYASSVVMDAASEQVVLLTDPYQTFQSDISSYSATTGAATSTVLALSGSFPVAMANLGNGWVAVISQWSANARNNANAIANLDIANAASGVDYAIPASSYFELSDFTQQYTNGLPAFSNLVQANPSQNMVYILGPSGTEIQPIPISSLGIDLRGAAHR